MLTGSKAGGCPTEALGPVGPRRLNSREGAGLTGSLCWGERGGRVGKEVFGGRASSRRRDCEERPERDQSVGSSKRESLGLRRASRL